MLATLTSGWTGHVHRHGAAICFAAAGWGLAVAAAGLAPNLALALAAFYLVEARRSGAFELGALASGRVRAYPLAPDEAHHDPPLLSGTAAIRAWFPVTGVAEACVELRLSPQSVSAES